MISFFIPGVPRSTQPGSSIRLPNGRTFQPKKNTDWTSWVRLTASVHAPKEPLEGAVGVKLRYVLPRPKSVAKNVKHPFRRPDLENYGKGLFDALTDAGLWHDDAQIVVMHLSKEYGEQPGVHVEADEM